MWKSSQWTYMSFILLTRILRLFGKRTLWTRDLCTSASCSQATRQTRLCSLVQNEYIKNGCERLLSTRIVRLNKEVPWILYIWSWYLLTPCCTQSKVISILSAESWRYEYRVWGSYTIKGPSRCCYYRPYDERYIVLNEMVYPETLSWNIIWSELGIIAHIRW